MATRIEDSVNGRINSWPGSEQSQQKIRIIVVDDQRLFRESVAGVLSTESFIEVVGIAADGTASGISKLLFPESPAPMPRPQI